MKYEIGKIEGDISRMDPHKFIIEYRDDVLIYHAKENIGNESLDHIDIAKAYGIERVVGGGVAKPAFRDDTILEIGNKSTKYGGVPNEVLTEFMPLLQETYQGRLPNLKKIELTESATLDCWRGRSDRADVAEAFEKARQRQ